MSKPHVFIDFSVFFRVLRILKPL